MADSSLSDVVAALEREGAPYYWMLLKRDAVGSPWQLHALLVEAFPRPSNGRSFHSFRCVYDHVVAVAGRAAGQEIGDWLTRGRGEVVVGERAEQSHTYAFSLPPLLSPDVPTIHGHQIASHLTYGATTAPWPYRQYGFPLQVRSTQRPDGPFIGSGDCHSFPDFHALIADLVYGVTHRASGLIHVDNEAVTIRIAQTSAWLDHIVLSPSGLGVTIVGSDVRGARLEVKGSPDVAVVTLLEQGIEQVDIDRQSFRLDVSLQEAPSDLWVFLSRDGVWLDEHWPTADPFLLGPVAHNVTVVPPATPADAKRTTLYPPFTLTPREGEEYRKVVDERAAAFAVSDEQFADYVRVFLARYRRTLETFFPAIAPYIAMYQHHPFVSFVLRIGTRGAIIGQVRQRRCGFSTSMILTCAGRLAHPAPSSATAGSSGNSVARASGVWHSGLRLVPHAAYESRRVDIHALPGVAARSPLAARNRVEAHTRRAPISRYSVTIQDQADVLSRLLDG